MNRFKAQVQNQSVQVLETPSPVKKKYTGAVSKTMLPIQSKLSEEPQKRITDEHKRKYGFAFTNKRMDSLQVLEPIEKAEMTKVIQQRARFASVVNSPQPNGSDADQEKIPLNFFDNQNKMNASTKKKLSVSQPKIEYIEEDTAPLNFFETKSKIYDQIKIISSSQPKRDDLRTPLNFFETKSKFNQISPSSIKQSVSQPKLTAIDTLKVSNSKQSQIKKTYQYLNSQSSIKFDPRTHRVTSIIADAPDNEDSLNQNLIQNKPLQGQKFYVRAQKSSQLYEETSIPQQQQQDKQGLDVVIDELQNFLVDIIGKPDNTQQDPKDVRKMQSIMYLVEKIQYHMSQVQVPEPSHNKNRQEDYSSIIQDDQTVKLMLDDMLQDDQNNNIQQSLKKKKAYLDEKLFQLSKKQKKISQPQQTFYSHRDTPNKESDPNNENLNQSMSPYPQNQKMPTQVQSNIIAERYGIKLELQVVQELLKTRKTPPNILSFLLNFLQEKADHQPLHSKSFRYTTSIKLFPLQFYSALTNQQIQNTSKIEYFQASRFTFDHTGFHNTIFDLFDWIVFPIMELPSEYSIVIGSLKNKILYCFQLSNIGQITNDQTLSSPLKNQYLKNIQTFLQKEFEVKCSRSKGELGDFKMVFGKIHQDANYDMNLLQGDSGLFTIFIIIHLIKNGNLQGILIEEEQMKKLSKWLYDIIVRIGQFQDTDIYHIYNENKWPF